MSGIFISYRRMDTLPWAGRLFADLRKSFGAPQVFMDINGGIPRGANFEQVLTAALASCDVLLALIGPQWTTCTRIRRNAKAGSSRRLGPQRNRYGACAGKSQSCRCSWAARGSRTRPILPEDLRGLLKLRSRRRSPTSGGITMSASSSRTFSASPLLKQLHDVATTNTGFGRLKDLIAMSRLWPTR